MQGLMAIIVVLGNLVSYEGSVENKYYFQVNTPEADYGLVLDFENEPYLYCDTIFYRR